MPDILSYSPWLIVALMFFYQNKIFMTPADFEKAKGLFLEYLTSKFVTKDSCTINQKHIQEVIKLTTQGIKDDIAEIKDDIHELKEILIGKHEGI